MPCDDLIIASHPIPFYPSFMYIAPAVCPLLIAAWGIAPGLRCMLLNAEPTCLVPWTLRCLCNLVETRSAVKEITSASTRRLSFLPGQARPYPPQIPSGEGGGAAMIAPLAGRARPCTLLYESLLKYGVRINAMCESIPVFSSIENCHQMRPV